MDKFSIYEFLSFLLPGVIYVYIFQHISTWDFFNIHSTSDTEDDIIFICISLFVGLLLHYLSFYCIQKKFRWYKYILYRPLKNYLSNESIKIALKKIINIKGEKTIDEIFDEAYWYLEAYDKIGTSKMFQSMYFYLRNFVIGYIVSLPYMIIIYFLQVENQNSLLFIVSGFIISFVVIFFLADFYRMKMTERILCNYAQLLEDKS